MAFARSLHSVYRYWSTISCEPVLTRRSEGQIGKLKPYVPDIVITLWERDLLEQWRTQISIPSILETAHKIIFKMGYIPRKGIGKELSRKITSYTGCP